MSGAGEDLTRVLAVIPAYREERHIRDVVERTLPLVQAVLVVDDGSPDRTAGEAKAGGAEVLRRERNGGKGASIKDGLRAALARPEISHVVLLDADGQHLPEELPRFTSVAARPEVALILGNRMTDVARMPLVRRLTNQVMSGIISRLCGQTIPDSQCGYRLLRRDVLPVILRAEADRYDFETEMLYLATRAGFAVHAVPVSTVYGEEKSKINPLHDTVRFFRLLRRLRRSA